MLRQSDTKSSGSRLQGDLDLIDGGFTDYLRQRHTADFTVALYCRFLRRVARHLAQRGRCAATLRRRDVPQVMCGCLPGWKVTSRRTRRSGLLQWLRFTGRFRERVPRPRWQGWLDAYEHFLRVDRALADCTRAASLRVLNHYLSWQFGNRLLRWNAVRADDLRRYTASRCRTLVPKASTTRSRFCDSFCASCICEASARRHWCWQCRRSRTSVARGFLRYLMRSRGISSWRLLTAGRAKADAITP